MEHSCEKCGQAVEDGVAFCPRCATPQIRVPSPLPSELGASSEAGAALRSGVLQSSPAVVLPMRWAPALRPCALSAVLAILATVLGLLFPAAVLAAGFLAVALYRRNNPGTEIGARIGARLGAISGFFFSTLSTIFLLVAVSSSDSRRLLQEKMLENASRWTSSYVTGPDLQATLERLKSPEVFAVSLVVGTALSFIVCMVLGAAGGALGSVFFRRKDRV